MTTWDELRTRLAHIVFRRSIDEVADAIPVHRRTVYRLIQGDIRRPSHAVRAGIERLVEEDRER